MTTRARRVAVLPALLFLCPVATAQNAGAPATPPTTQAAADLPAARTLVERAIDAAGGAHALRDVKTVRYDLTAATPQGESVLTMSTARGNRVHVTTETPMGQVEMGRIGDVAWAKSPNGYELLPKEQLGQVTQLDMVGLLLNLSDNVESMQTIAQVPFDGRPCTKVRFLRNKSEAFAYFDDTDGTLRGFDESRETPMGPMPMTTTFSAYQQVGNFKFVRTAGITVAQMALATITVSNVKVNELTLESFVLPEEVKTLVAEKAAAATSRPAGAHDGHNHGEGDGHDHDHQHDHGDHDGHGHDHDHDHDH
ncbi:MAG: hypothetical protein KJO43_07865 [Phycisphaerae bacterium]|nr:hypothetical protein [Phycisphaerae bacterium]